MVILYIPLTGPLISFIGILMFFYLGFGALWGMVKAFRFHIIRIRIQRLIKERDRLLDRDDESYRDVQREIDELILSVDEKLRPLLKKQISKWCAEHPTEYMQKLEREIDRQQRETAAWWENHRKEMKRIHDTYGD